MTNSPAQDSTNGPNADLATNLVDLTDPGISPHRLQELAATHPQSWDEILAHPNVYPGLAQWIHDRQAEQPAQPEPVEHTADDAGEGTDVAETTQATEDSVLPADAVGTPDQTAVYEPIDETRVFQDDPVAEEGAAQDITEDAAAQVTAEPGEVSVQDPVEEPVQEPVQDRAQDPVSEPAQPTTQTSAWANPHQQPQYPHQPAQPVWGVHSPTPQPGAFPGQQPQGGQAQPGQQGQAHPGPSYPGQQVPGQPYGYQQPGYGQPYGFGQQPYAHVPRRRPSGSIDLNSATTWGLFVAGGAAFLGLFGFFFSPTISSFAIPASSHLAAGGWITLLLFLATVTLSILQLLRPSTWMRYFFSIVSLGATFSMIGRATALIGMFGMNSTSFSVIWLLFMSFVLLAGTMVFMAPRNTDSTADQQPQD